MTTATEYGAEFVQDDPKPKGVTFSEAVGGILESIEHGRPIIETIPTGLALLDDTTGGLVRGEYVGIVAAPGIGKSTIADNLVIGTLRENPAATALVFNLETSTPVRTARIIAGQAVQVGAQNQIVRCVPVGALLRGELEPPGKAVAMETAHQLCEEIGGRLRFVDDVHNAGMIAGLIRGETPDLVLIDHLGLVGFDNGENGSTIERFDAALSVIVAALKVSNAAGILINEVSKAGLIEGAADLTAVRGSARFASLAGAYIGIVRDPEDTERDARLLVQLRKNRHGRDRMQQAARFFAGLSYLWWEREPNAIPPETKQSSRKKKEGAA